MPADNLVSKLNAQKGATAGDIIKQMGWYNLFTRGLGLRIIMIGTLTGLQVRRTQGARGAGSAFYRPVGMQSASIDTLDGTNLCSSASCSSACALVLHPYMAARLPFGPVAAWVGVVLLTHGCVVLSRACFVPQWGIYDAFKVAAGLPTTGAKVPTPEPAKV